MAERGRTSKILIIGAALVGVSYVLFTRWRQKLEMRKRKRRKKQGSVNIGGKYS